MSEVLSSPLKKIILVEDSSFSRALIKAQLRKLQGVIIDCPDSSPEALELITSKLLADDPYDLIITDLNMPDLDGLDLVTKIKEDPMGKDLDIIIITADPDNSLQRVCDQLGVLAYFTKPFEPKNFVEVIRAALEKRELPPIKKVI